MPSFIGQVVIGNISGGNLQNGDIIFNTPISVTKTSNGSGSVNTGPFVITINTLDNNAQV
ncbi:spore germination protein [Bacillus spongiae]|uniref:Spore germination protein n=1 Tax=Bacillus spongiae TaxID=2683610 RepID=A0ABU8HGV1_9BACI